MTAMAYPVAAGAGLQAYGHIPQDRPCIAYPAGLLLGTRFGGGAPRPTRANQRPCGVAQSRTIHCLPRPTRATIGTLDDLGGHRASPPTLQPCNTKHSNQGFSAHEPPARTLRVGIGGPVGSGKTTLTEKLCKAMRERYSVAAITNDIYTKEDALILNRLQALPEDRIMGVETGGCPHTAIREDASINLAAIDEMVKRFPDLDVIFIESGGDNLAATFSPELADITLYVISVCQGEKIPRKGGPAITRSDLLIINKADLAPHVMADLDSDGGRHPQSAGGAALRFHRSCCASKGLQTWWPSSKSTAVLRPKRPEHGIWPQACDF